MAVDCVLIGSGLSALGAGMALASQEAKVLCITGPDKGVLETYPSAPVVANFDGDGGLGRYWHGVAPLSAAGFSSISRNDIDHFLAHFYPGLNSTPYSDDSLFVPFRPIRPHTHLKRLATENPNFVLRSGTVQQIEELRQSVRLRLKDGETIEAANLVLAAGALGTVRLLMRSNLINENNRTVSDHVIGYAGRIRRERVIEQLARPISRSRHGMILPCNYSDDRSVLYLLRPARFDFASLDVGVEKRAIFGLPTSRILAGLLGRFSPGLLAEAFYNRFGFGRAAPWQSVGYFIEGSNIYSLDRTGRLIAPPVETIRRLSAEAVSKVPYEGLEPTGRPDLYIPGIHLHASLTAEERERFAPETASPIKVVDASRLFGIGPAHHSLKMMIAAHAALQRQ